jgi:hypothetical protein
MNHAENEDIASHNKISWLVVLLRAQWHARVMG